jgi:hypothetical protein
MRRWGQIAEPKTDDWYMEAAKKVYRPDIYRVAAEELIAEGHMAAEEFPDFETETGFKPKQSGFIDGVDYDGSKPNARANRENRAFLRNGPMPRPPLHPCTDVSTIRSGSDQPASLLGNATKLSVQQ